VHLSCRALRRAETQLSSLPNPHSFCGRYSLGSNLCATILVLAGTG
jgi:hypothetical protein